MKNSRCRTLRGCRWATPAAAALFALAAGFGGAMATGSPASALPSSRAAAVAKGQSYAGNTSQGAPVVITVSRDGRRITRLVIFWHARCTSGTELTFRSVMPGRKTAPPSPSPGQYPFASNRISRGGSFQGTSSGTIDLGKTYRGALVQKVSGKLGATAGAGSWRAHVDIIERASGQKKFECDTERLRWRAPKPQRLFYGGATTQQMPVVVQLTRSRSKVRRIRIGWSARCTREADNLPEAPLSVGDSLADFPLRRGAFGDSFTQTSSNELGGEDAYAYRVKGRVGRTRASGTFSVVVTKRNKSGATVATCKSPGIRWSAHQ